MVKTIYTVIGNICFATGSEDNSKKPLNFVSVEEHAIQSLKLAKMLSVIEGTQKFPDLSTNDNGFLSCSFVSPCICTADINCSTNEASYFSKDNMEHYMKEISGQIKILAVYGKKYEKNFDEITYELHHGISEENPYTGLCIFTMPDTDGKPLYLRVYSEKYIINADCSDPDFMAKLKIDTLYHVSSDLAYLIFCTMTKEEIDIVTKLIEKDIECSNWKNVELFFSDKRYNYTDISIVTMNGNFETWWSNDE